MIEEIIFNAMLVGLGMMIAFTIVRYSKCPHCGKYIMQEKEE